MAPLDAIEQETKPVGGTPTPLPARRQRYERSTEVTMQFEVNGQSYFLQFSQEENEWLLFRPVEDGVEQVEIENDTVRPDSGGVMIPFGNDRGTVN